MANDTLKSVRDLEMKRLNLQICLVVVQKGPSGTYKDLYIGLINLYTGLINLYTGLINLYTGLIELKCFN